MQLADIYSDIASIMYNISRIEQELARLTELVD